ncbi:pseudouridylate synthase [Clostridiales bacterium KLE1615]|nr:pseudouridylate synthase [Clostridiales bacterium KLE1615]
MRCLFTKKGYLYMEETVRLNKFLSEKGICSRREADRLVDEGKVMVNGVCAVMGQKVSSADEIVVDGKKVSTKQVKPVLIAVNKPAGIVCTTARFEGEKNIVDMVKYPTRIYPIGRLDKESEGLILMTNLGDLANEISKASNSHEKEYVVTVNNQVTESFLDKMRRGMHLEELNADTMPCVCTKTGNREFHIILKQGLNRQIRRMCAACGYRVETLKRIRIMNIHLGNIPQGNFRNVTDAEFDKLIKTL